MVLPGNEYLNYIKDYNSLFYKIDSNKKNLFKYYKNSGCKYHDYSNDFWHYIFFNHELPKQGWKIHITANSKDAQQLLLVVSKFLFMKQITFKFINTKEDFTLSNSKYAERSESGKFITVYPQTVKTFLKLLIDLSNITNTFLEGPYILSDRQWKESHIFYRYGAFKEMKTIIDGKEVYAIETDTHKLIEDKRLPYYTKPDFVEEPKMLKENKHIYKKEEFDHLKKFNINSALHFSNAGGVYYSEVKNKKYVLKEGRAFAGLDSKGLDGFERITHEFEILKQLAEVKEVVRVYECFKVWKHQYLVEEYVEGETLSDFIDEQYPFSNIKKNKEHYVKSIIEIITQVIRAVEKVHSLGIAIGDLQPENIMLERNNGQIKIKLIDFEGAQSIKTPYQPGLATPGYSDLNAKNFEEADHIAIYKIARFCILPIASDFDWDPEIIKQQNKNISSEFGQIFIDFFKKIESKLQLNFNLPTRHPQWYRKNLQLPKTKFSLDNIDKNKKEVAKGIVSNFDFSFNGLIRGDIIEYDTPLNCLSVANGGFGAIMALQRSDELSEDCKMKIDGWIESQKRNIKLLLKCPNKSYGLYTGLSGVACVLYENGYIKLSKLIMDRLLIAYPENDVSIYSGISGLGLAYLCFYLKTNNSLYLFKAKQLSSQILKQLSSFNFDQFTDVGLISGWLGASLFLWKMYLVCGNIQYKNQALRILHLVSSRYLYTDKKSAYIVDNSLSYERHVPYVNSGSAGLALLIIEILRDESKSISQNEKNILYKLINTNNVFVTYFSGLFDGFLSLMILDNTLKICGYGKQTLEKKYKNLNNYVYAQDGGVLLPGAFSFKCSLDVTTGSSGLLLLLADIKNKKWNAWLPLLQSDKLRFFE